MRFNRLCSVCNTKQQKTTLFSFIMFYPLMELLAGVPVPIPFSIFDLSPQAFAMFQFISLIVAILGGMVTIGFALRNNSKAQAKEQNEKIDVVEKKVDKKADEIKSEMHNMETRLCATIEVKIKYLERIVEDKTVSAKILEDERFSNVNRRLDDVEDR